MSVQQTLERAVIGLALTGDPRVALDLDRVRPAHFADPRHGAVWGLIRAQEDAGRPTDAVTVAASLPRIPAGERVGIDDAYLLDCLHAAPSPAPVLAASYADRLIQAAGHRSLSIALIRARQILDAVPDPVEADAQIRAALDEAAPDTQAVGQLIGEGIDATINGIEQPGRLAPTPWTGINDRIGGWRPGALHVVGARPGAGKALWVRTPIPTPTGWTTMGALDVGDLVLGRDGIPTRVTQATTVMYGHECYRVEFSDGTSVIADADHRWLTETRASRKAQNAAAHCPHTSRLARWQRQHFPQVVTTRQIAATVRTRDGRANHALPDTAPVELPEADLPLDPYILGCWLGDGSSYGATLHVWERDVEHVRRALDRAGYATSERRDGSCVRIRFSTTPIRHGGPAQDSAQRRLRDLGVLRNKHIPGVYLRASRTQRVALLQGLLDSDGHVGKTGDVEYCTVDATLARDVMELTRTLGVRPTCTTRTVKGRDAAHSTAYRIHGMFTREHMTLARKAERLPERRRRLRRYVTAVVKVPSVPVRCIQVDNPDHLYLCGEGLIPTHNTIMGLQAAYGLAHQGAVAVSSLEMPRREVHTRLLAHAAQVPLGHINGQGRPDGAEWDRIARAAGVLRNLPVSIDDRPDATVWDVASHARLLARRGPLAGVVVDYMQLMSTPRGERRPRHEVVAEQSRRLKVLAGTLDCPVIALSQLNRASQGRADLRPSLADLRESGAIEQDADVVLLLHVPLEGGVPDQGRLDVLVAKNRHGTTGPVRLRRDGATATLDDLTWAPS